MKWDSESVVVKFALISRRIVLSSIVFFASAAILLLLHGAKWLILGLFITGALLFCVSWVVPGILIIFRQPKLAYAWLNGRNPLAFSDIPWELLSSKQRRSVYADSMLTFFAVIAFIIWLISEQ